MEFESFYNLISIYVADRNLAKIIFAECEECTWKKNQKLPQNTVSLLLTGVVSGVFLSGKGKTVTYALYEKTGKILIYPHEGTTLTAECETTTITIKTSVLAMLAEEYPALNVGWYRILADEMENIKTCRTARNCLKGQQRYAWFLKEFPNSSKVVRSKAVASFIVLWAESMSRIKGQDTELISYPQELFKRKIIL